MVGCPHGIRPCGLFNVKRKRMKLLDFSRHYPDEAACRRAFKEMRDRKGVICQHCGSRDTFWLESKGQYQCKHCRRRTTLRSGTVMHGSKLPFMYWFIAMHLLTATKKSISAAELQRQLGHKRYQPIWEMMHKLRSVMGKRDGEYALEGCVELDEGFFSTEVPAERKSEKLKAGAGSQRKTKVLVMAESSPVEMPKRGKKVKYVGHIKMAVIPDMKSSTIDAVASDCIDNNSHITTDASASHVHFKNIFARHIPQVIEPEEIGRILPWVHIAIANAKTLFADMYHGVKPEFLQEYLNEFCYKFNRRYFGEELFGRLLSISASYRADFAHRIYNGNVA